MTRPKPTEKRRTLTPNQRATMKWPSSWKTTSTPSTTMNARNFCAMSISQSATFDAAQRFVRCASWCTGRRERRNRHACNRRSSCGERDGGKVEPATRDGARGAVGGKRVVEALHRHRRKLRERLGARGRDVGEPDGAVEECGHGDFIGGIQHGGCGASGIER